VTGHFDKDAASEGKVRRKSHAGRREETLWRQIEVEDMFTMKPRSKIKRVLWSTCLSL